MKTITGDSDVKQILSIQRKRSFELRTESLKERKRRLKNLERWILENRGRIHEAVYADLRKSADETDISEVFPALTEVRDALKNLSSWAEPRSVSPSLPYIGTKGKIIYEPKGVCLVISPWNYPFNLTVGPVVSGLAAGNTICIKPSEYTPHTSQLLEDMAKELYDESIVTVFQGDYRVSRELLEQSFDHIFFTGSPKVGKIVMEAAAKHLTSVTLELGGKSPTIVDSTASLKSASERIAWGKWLNAGQTCVAPDYVFVHSSVATDFISELESSVRKLYGKQENYTGIVNQSHYGRLHELLSDAIDKGAKVEFSLESNQEERKMGPVVVSNVALDSKLMEEEIFGPVLPLLTFDQLDEVIAFINERPKPLALYHFTGKKANSNQMIQETSAGSMCINDCVLQFSHPELPFGGVNNSGIGKGHGHFGFLEFSNQKSLLKQREGMTMAKTLYPPFDKIKKTTLNLLLKYF